MAGFTGTRLALGRVRLDRRHVDTERQTLLAKLFRLVGRLEDLVQRDVLAFAIEDGVDDLATGHERCHASFAVDTENRFLPAQVGTGLEHLAGALDSLGTQGRLCRLPVRHLFVA